MPNKNIKKRPGRGGRAAAASAEQTAAQQRSAFKAAEARRAHRTQAARDIESAFSKLSAPQLEQLGLDAHYARLPRPVPARNAVFEPAERFGEEWAVYERAQAARKAGRAAKSSSSTNGDDSSAGPAAAPGSGATGATTSKAKALKPLLTLPKRPRWNRDMNKKALESNEAEVFRSWLAQTDELVASHSRGLLPTEGTEWGSEQANAPGANPARSKIPSQFERNLSVFAQLWRVSERSDILCVLLDSRCPLLHLPPSLIDFLRAKAGRRTLLVLTKADLVPRAIAEAWRAWLLEQFGEWTDVVITESYRELGTREGQGSRSTRASFMAPDSRLALINSLKRIHAQLVRPPARLKEANNGQDAQEWTPPCVEHVDWDVFDRLDRYAGQPPDSARKEEPPSGEGSNDFLTIGLIGQPNVGKSSMLNALLGSKLVRASKTPGKTKAFQTHFVGQHQGLARPPPPPSTSTATSPTTPTPQTPARIRLCDSPGLVFPSLIGMEMQVLGAILPISQVQALSSCVRFAGAHMPLEEALRLPLAGARAPDPAGHGGRSQQMSGGAGSSPAAAAAAAKETGTEGDQQQQEDEEDGEAWTAMRILEHVAARYNFRTAKANRWDTNRAGNWVMRALAEGRIPWAFRPPALAAQSGASVDSEQQEREERSGAKGKKGGGGAAAAAAAALSKADELDADALLKRGKGIWLGAPHVDAHDGDGTADEDADEDASDSQDDDDDDDDGTEGRGGTHTEHESPALSLSQSLTAPSLGSSTASVSAQGPPAAPAPIRINFRHRGVGAGAARSATAAAADSDGDDSASPGQSSAGGKKKKGKGKGKKGQAPVLSKRARLREEGLALLVHHPGGEGDGADAPPRRGPGDEDEDEDNEAGTRTGDEWTTTERASSLGGSVFLAAAASGAGTEEEGDEDEDEENEEDEVA